MQRLDNTAEKQIAPAISLWFTVVQKSKKEV